MNILTKRQLEVAKLVTYGLSNKEIATRLSISVSTVKGHVTAVMTRLNVSSRVEIATWCLQHPTGDVPLTERFYKAAQQIVHDSVVRAEAEKRKKEELYQKYYWFLRWLPWLR